MLIEATYGNAGTSYPSYGSSASQAAERSEAARRARPETAPLPAPSARPEPKVTEATQTARTETSIGASERLPGLVARSEIAFAAAVVEDKTPLIQFQEAVAADGIPESFPRERRPVVREEPTPTEEQVEALDTPPEAAAEEVAAPEARSRTAPTAEPREAAAAPETGEAGKPVEADAPAEPSRAEQRIRQAEELTQQVSIVNGQRPASVLDILR